MSSTEERSDVQPFDLSMSMELDGNPEYEAGELLTASQDQLVDQVLAVDLGNMDQLLEVIGEGPNPGPEDEMRAHLMMVRQILDVQPDPAKFMELLVALGGRSSINVSADDWLSYVNEYPSRSGAELVVPGLVRQLQAYLQGQFRKYSSFSLSVPYLPF